MPGRVHQRVRLILGAAATSGSGNGNGEVMSDTAKALLEGGPKDLPERIVPVPPPGTDVKIEFLGGYEHFRATPRHADTPEGRLPVYEWWERTEFAG